MITNFTPTYKIQGICNLKHLFVDNVFHAIRSIYPALLSKVTS